MEVANDENVENKIVEISANQEDQQKKIPDFEHGVPNEKEIEVFKEKIVHEFERLELEEKEKQEHEQVDIGMDKSKQEFVQEEEVKEAIIEEKKEEISQNKEKDIKNVEEVIILETTTTTLTTTIEEVKLEKEIDPIEADIKSIDNIMEAIKDHFYNTLRLESAYEEYMKYNNLCKELLTKNIPKINDYITELNKKYKVFFDDLLWMYNYLLEILQILQDEKDWSTEKNAEGYTIKYKSKGSDIASLKIEGFMDVPLEHLLSLIYEIELYDHWLPMTRQSLELKAVSKGCKFSYLRMNIPPPLSDREALILGFGVDRFHIDGRVIILAKSIDNEKHIYERNNVKLPTNRSDALLIMNASCFEFTPITRNRVKFRFIVNVNPNIRFLPNSIMSFILRKSGSMIFERLNSKSKAFKGSIWEKQMHTPEGKKFYDWLTNRINVEMSAKGM